MNAAGAAAVSGSDYEKAKAIHDYLCANNTYSSAITDTSYNAYGSLVLKDSVCQGYAHAFKIMCDLNGLDCICVSGTGISTDGSERHMWNIVKIDGKWYAVDVTWDDQSRILYDYFLSGSDTADTHFNKKKFTSTHIADSAYTYPTLSKTAYELPSTEVPTAEPTQAPTQKPTDKPTATNGQNQ